MSKPIQIVGTSLRLRKAIEQDMHQTGLIKLVDTHKKLVLDHLCKILGTLTLTFSIYLTLTLSHVLTLTHDLTYALSLTHSLTLTHDLTLTCTNPNHNPTPCMSKP